MWTCADCGLEFIEDTQEVCPACGALRQTPCPPTLSDFGGILITLSPCTITPSKAPRDKATWPQCAALYKDTNHHLRLWKGEDTTITKQAASALIRAIRTQQAKGRSTFSFSLERGNEALQQVNFQTPDFADWRAAGFPLR